MVFPFSWLFDCLPLYVLLAVFLLCKSVKKERLLISLEIALVFLRVLFTQLTERQRPSQLICPDKIKWWRYRPFTSWILLKGLLMPFDCVYPTASSQPFAPAGAVKYSRWSFPFCFQWFNTCLGHKGITGCSPRQVEISSSHWIQFLWIP